MGGRAQLIPFAELIAAPVRQGGSLRETAHRPWPLPEGSWVMAQTCEQQLFVHWRVDVAALRPHVPDKLSIDRFDGSAWLGLTPFVVSGLRGRGMFPLPLLSSFRELNVRTYVTFDDRPGIWFFSLDASSQLAVEAARRLYRLPFYRARISLQRSGDRILYECVRHEGKAFSGAYAPGSDIVRAQPGTPEHFLTERYCLYAEERGRLFRAEIHHRPWPLRAAEGRIDLNTMPPEDVVLEGEPLLHFSGRQDVVLWPLREVSGDVT